MNPRIAIFIRGHGEEFLYEPLTIPILNTVISKMQRVGSCLLEDTIVTRPTIEYVRYLQEIYTHSISEGIRQYIEKMISERDEYKQKYETIYNNPEKIIIDKEQLSLFQKPPPSFLEYHMEEFKSTPQMRSFLHDKMFIFTEYDPKSKSEVFTNEYGVFIVQIYDYVPFEKGQMINIITKTGLEMFLSLCDVKQQSIIKKTTLYNVINNFDLVRIKLGHLLSFFKEIGFNHVHIIDQTCRLYYIQSEYAYNDPTQYPLMRAISTQEKQSAESIQTPYGKKTRKYKTKRKYRTKYKT